MAKSYKSDFEIGELVLVRLQSKTLKGHIRAVIFTSSKVRYSVLIAGDETTLHNVDSVFICSDRSHGKEVLDMPEDNYS